jgi:hypothetical protein
MTKIFKVLGKVFFVTSCVAVILMLFIFVYSRGYIAGKNDSTNTLEKLKSENISSTTKPAKTTIPTVKKIWGGPDLWVVINKRRVELGVNALSQKDEICTIASIRLNELLDLGKLDGHEGFSKLAEERTDLKWIFEKYNVSEFLVSGVSSATDAVSLWENSLGHKKLLTGGEYVWGCTYAQDGFGVAIAAY